VWRKLTAHFERKTTASRAHTRSQLHRVRMKSDEAYDLYRARVMALAMQLRGMGEEVSESELVYVLLQGLPSSYKGVQEALEVQDHLSLDSISDKLRDIQERRNLGDAAEEEHAAMYAAPGGQRGGAGGGGRGGYRGGRTTTGHAHNHSSNRNTRGKYDETPQDEMQHRCNLCRAHGHWERFCPASTRQR